MSTFVMILVKKGVNPLNAALIALERSGNQYMGYLPTSATRKECPIL